MCLLMTTLYSPAAAPCCLPSAEAIEKMGYCAAGLGPQDLRLPDTALLATSAEHDLFVAANYSILEQTPRFRIVEAGGSLEKFAAVPHPTPQLPSWIGQTP